MKKSFVIHIDSLAVLDELTDEQAGMLFRAIKNYHAGGDEPENLIIRLAFAPFKNQFTRDEEKYQSVIERNRNNGQKGGRPVEKHKRVTYTGKEIPESTDLHYVYIIKDVLNNEYKIGETSDLVERRNTIKRPSGNLEIVDFILLPKQKALEVEKNFIEKFVKYRTSGDWFDFSTIDITIPIGYLNSQITQSVNNYPKKPDSVNDSDSDSKNDKETDKKENSKEFSKSRYEQECDIFDEKLEALLVQLGSERRMVTNYPYIDIILDFNRHWTNEILNGKHKGRPLWTAEKTFDMKGRLRNWFNIHNQRSSNKIVWPPPIQVPSTYDAEKIGKLQAEQRKKYEAEIAAKSPEERQKVFDDAERDRKIMYDLYMKGELRND